MLGTRQRRMLMSTPLMQAKQHRTVGVQCASLARPQFPEKNRQVLADAQIPAPLVKYTANVPSQ